MLGLIGELLVPSRCTAPISTAVGWPSIGTIPITGEGGNPPPAKIDDRSPPQEALFGAAIDPEALNKLTKYPRASPSTLPHDCAEAGNGRLVLNVTMPATMTELVTPCSPVPFAVKSRYQPFLRTLAVDSNDADEQVEPPGLVKFSIVAPSRSIPPILVDAGAVILRLSL